MDTYFKGISVKNIPACNIMSQDAFQERVRVVFNLLKDILSKSFGPYGSMTLIADYPYYAATKDGYHIAQNISLDPEVGEPIDRIIYRMAMDICARLNYAVGDGTTTAIMATNFIYAAAIDLLKNGVLSPRALLKAIDEVKEAVIEEFNSEIKPINRATMTETIRNVALISSNDDVEITDMITSAYEEFGAPVLRCELGDGKKCYMVTTNGYRCKVCMGDELYINTGNKTGEFKKVNVMVFGHQVTMKAYKHIIHPLWLHTTQYGCPLMVIAPSYEDSLLHIHIRKDIMQQYEKDKLIDLIITAYPSNNATDKESINDLAMLLNTTVIDRMMEQEILDHNDLVHELHSYETGHNTQMDILVGSFPVLGSVDTCNVPQADKIWGGSEIKNSLKNIFENDGKPRINLGFADKVILGMKESVFEVSAYPKHVYEKYLEDAKAKLDSAISKYADLGTYTLEIYNAQYRYTSLAMKNATIYVGGDSQLSKNLRKDSVEDAIRATESAYYYGYVKGGNISLLRAIRSAERKSQIKEHHDVYAALNDAFSWVYQEVLLNYYRNTGAGAGENAEVLEMVEGIVENCVKTDSVYDPVIQGYREDVINSARTDIEVLSATTDLLRILLTGNQVLMARYNHRRDEV